MELGFLNEAQRRAVTTTEGPVLVLAGAGSGKTSVLTNRVAYLLQEKGVSPYAILAITFTNKAAAEMKERIAAITDVDVSRMAVSTFHSMCARFLRMDADSIGYGRNFTIYDASDSQTVVKKILAEKNIDSKQLTPRRCQAIISSAKNAGGSIPTEEFLAQAAPSFSDEMKAVYRAYEQRLKQENAMDFDDLLLNMLRLLRENAEVRDYYQNRFQYVMVDEYQDTNSVQYALVKLLSGKYKNLFVVGDDDQSIYAWRGADIRNILDFEKDYPSAAVIKLEQNYRSHDRILKCAGAVIEGAAERKKKTLWSARKEGPLPKVLSAPSEYAEAEFVAREIGRLVGEGKSYDDIAVLYRMHTQSRVLEEKLRTYGIPYQIYGGMSFFERKEIKDMIAYLTVLENPSADTALLRVLNTPRRGIGEVSAGRLADFAATQGISMLEAMRALDEGALRGKFASFLETYDRILAAVQGKSLGEVVEAVFGASGYREMLLLLDEVESETKIENVEELINSAYKFEKTAEDASLLEFLSSLSLITDMDTTAKEGAVTLMTLHSAKGLEFDTVFLVGMEENVFPSWRSINEENVDEERRLCYVGITRAKQLLYFTCCSSRNLYSGSSENPPSRFLEDIPPEMLEQLTPMARKTPEREKKPRPVVFKPQVEFKPQAKASGGEFAEGMEVEHAKFGRGKILSLAGEGEQKVALIAFPDAQRKMFVCFAPLTIVR